MPGFSWCSQLSCFHEQYIISHISPNKEKTHLITGANVLFLLPVHSHPRSTRAAMSKHTSLTFTDEASIVGRETKTQKIQDNRNICFPLLQGKKKIRFKYQLLIFTSSNISLTLLTILCHLLHIHPWHSHSGGCKIGIYSSIYNKVFITWCSK